MSLCRTTQVRWGRHPSHPRAHRVSAGRAPWSMRAPAMAGWVGVDDDLAEMRRAYSARRLLEADVPAEPYALFHSWLDDAVRAALPEPNAMVLATTDETGRPSTRHVLLKELDSTGFVFYTNLRSRKAVEIAVNPEVSLCFPWFAIERQVVVCGTAARITREEVAAYW